MIKYDRFWVTMKERGITQYDLYEHYQITRSLLDRLRKNKNVEIYTIDTVRLKILWSIFQSLMK